MSVDNFNREFDKVATQLSEYHKCVKFFNRGCMDLAEAFMEAGIWLEYAGRWVHRTGNRIGVLFTDVEKGTQRYISVPIYIFVAKNYGEFVKKYCKVDE